VLAAQEHGSTWTLAEMTPGLFPPLQDRCCAGLALEWSHAQQDLIILMNQDDVINTQKGIKP